MCNLFALSIASGVNTTYMHRHIVISSHFYNHLIIVHVRVLERSVSMVYQLTRSSESCTCIPGYRPPTIKMFDIENLKHLRVGVYNTAQSIGRTVGSGRHLKLTEIKQLVEQQMRIDDETTVYQLHRILRKNT